MFCSNEHYMSISHMAIFVYTATQHNNASSDNSVATIVIDNKKVKFGDRSRGWPGGSLFNKYNTEVLGWVLLHPLDGSTLHLIRTL